MANKEHLKILKKGVRGWNLWRASNPGIRPDLDDADLNKMDLSDINLRWTSLAGANLCEANLINAHLGFAALTDARFVRAVLVKAHLLGANFRNADFSRANFGGAFFGNVDLREAKLDEVNFRGANLSGTNLSGKDLNGANFIQADLKGVNFSQTNLSGAKFSSTILCRANLKDANLTKAYLVNADVGSANLSGANLSHATIGWTTFNDNDLSSVKGLEYVSHSGPSSIGIDTIYRSSGNIPEVFLRGCGVAENFITYMRSLSMEPIQFYSCFISYSSRDQPFAERLFADLQNRGVRCWFAPHDMKIGEKLRLGIDESIRVHEKLLVILSKHSVESDWVEKEVETALEHEREQKRTILFPIRLDDSVLRVACGWPADIRRTRHIGDFRRWKNHDTYQMALQRLLRDLMMEGTR